MKRLVWTFKARLSNYYIIVITTSTDLIGSDSLREILPRVLWVKRKLTSEPSNSCPETFFLLCRGSQLPAMEVVSGSCVPRCLKTYKKYLLSAGEYQGLSHGNSTLFLLRERSYLIINQAEGCSCRSSSRNLTFVWLFIFYWLKTKRVLLQSLASRVSSTYNVRVGVSAFQTLIELITIVMR
jgi:hypothetical protein